MRLGMGLAMVGACVLAQLAGCQAALERYQFERPEMGTKMRLVFYAQDEATAKAAADAAFERVQKLNAVMSDYIADSEINQLTATAGSGRAVPVSDDLWGVLSRAQEISAQTDGAFDITVGPVVKLWRKARKTGQLPNAVETAAAVCAIGHKKLVLDAARRTARLHTRGMQLDLGGIGKGYAADAALKVLRDRGIRSALVAVAGDIVVADPPPGRDAWRIAVDPFGAMDGSPASLASRTPEAEVPRIPGVAPASSVRFLLLRNAAVSTSGDVHQHIDIAGKRYSHIVDPKTGIGLTNAIAVTVVAPDATTSDALAKVGVFGVERAIQIIDAIPGAAALIARNDDGRIKLFESAAAKDLKFDHPNQ